MDEERLLKYQLDDEQKENDQLRTENAKLKAERDALKAEYDRVYKAIGHDSNCNYKSYNPNELCGCYYMTLKESMLDYLESVKEKNDEY